MCEERSEPKRIRTEIKPVFGHTSTTRKRVSFDGSTGHTRLRVVLVDAGLISVPILYPTRPKTEVLRFGRARLLPSRNAVERAAQQELRPPKKPQFVTDRSINCS